MEGICIPIVRISYRSQEVFSSGKRSQGLAKTANLARSVHLDRLLLLQHLVVEMAALRLHLASHLLLGPQLRPLVSRLRLAQVRSLHLANRRRAHPRSGSHLNLLLSVPRLR